MFPPLSVIFDQRPETCLCLKVTVLWFLPRVVRVIFFLWGLYESILSPYGTAVMFESVHH